MIIIYLITKTQYRPSR